MVETEAGETVEVYGGGTSNEIVGDSCRPPHSCVTPSPGFADQVSEFPFDFGAGAGVVGLPVGVVGLFESFSLEKVFEAVDTDCSPLGCGGAELSEWARHTAVSEAGSA